MDKVKNIMNGWKNYLTGTDPADLDVARSRAKICAECDTSTYGTHTAILPEYVFGEIKGMYCDKKKGGCGCPLSTAVRSKDYKCPKKYW